MRVFFLLATAFLIFNGARFGSAQSNANNATSSTQTSTKNVKKTSVQTKNQKKSEIRSVAEFNIYPITGVSERKNADDVDQPPFSHATLFNLYHDRATRIGEKITVIPLKSSVAPFELKIVKSTRIEQECDGSIVWETIFEPITDAAITAMKPMNIDTNPRDVTLLDAVVIYPAVANAVLVPNDRIVAASLPARITPKMLQAAVDVDADGKPDLILTEDKSFKKIGGKWQLIKEFLNEDC